MRDLNKAIFGLLIVAGLLINGAITAHGQPELNTLDPKPNGAVRVVIVQPDGKILIGGSFTTLWPNGGMAVTRNHIARLNADGTLDAAFDPDANTDVESIALQSDGKILVGGQFTSVGRQKRSRIARLEPNTGLADSFDPNASERVYSIAVQKDGRILVGGVFKSIGGQRRNYLARLDSNTGLADAFDPSPDTFGVYTIALQADGQILVGGSFRNVGGQRRNSIARLDATTGQADSFDPEALGIGQPFSTFYAIAVQPDGKILVGGQFSEIGGVQRDRIARLDAHTGLPDSFDPIASGGDSQPDISAIAVQPDGKIIVGGAFTNIGGQKRNHLARLDAETGLADAFDPSPDAIGIYAIALQTDGQILAGGSFGTIAGHNRSHFARLNSNDTASQNASAPPSSAEPINELSR